MKLLALCGIVLVIAWWFRPSWSQPVTDTGFREDDDGVTYA